MKTMLVRKMYVINISSCLCKTEYLKKMCYFIRIVSNFFMWKSSKVYNFFRASEERYKPSKLRKNLN